VSETYAHAPPDVAAAFNAMVEERGGPGRFNDFQLDVALAVAGLVRDMHRAAPTDRARFAEAAAKLLAQLPAPVPKARESRIPTITPEMSIETVAKLFAAELREDEWPYEDWERGTLKPIPVAPVPPAALPRALAARAPDAPAPTYAAPAAQPAPTPAAAPSAAPEREGPPPPSDGVTARRYEFAPLDRPCPAPPPPSTASDARPDPRLRFFGRVTTIAGGW